MSDIDPSGRGLASGETHHGAGARRRARDVNGGLAPDEVIKTDLEALRSSSSRKLPTMEDTTHALYEHVNDTTQGGVLMASIRRLRGRPALTTALATAIMAAALLVVPVSYQQTMGHDVILTVSGPGMDDAAAGRVASEMKSALDADNVTLSAATAEPALKMIRLGTNPSAAGTPALHSEGTSFSSPARSSYTFKARVGSPSRANVEAATAALARILAERGMDAEFGVAVVKEKVSGNVYAMALDKVLQIRVDSEGKSSDEIAAEIRSHLENAGLPNPEVTVSQDGNMMKIAVRACGDDMPCEELPEISLDIDGMDMDSPNARKIAVHRTPDMTDADVIAEVERQLREQGVDAEVTIVDGRIEIEIND